MYDVIVIGAGPAGAVLAYLLARRGLKVVILEKANLPRYKTCGGGVTWKALQNLPFDASPVFERKAAGGIVTYSGKPMLKAELGWPVAWLVMRERFDQFLTQQALDAGAHLMQGVDVEYIEEQEGYVIVHAGNDHFTAQYLAGADGVNSIVARSLGLLEGRQVGVALEAEIAVPSASLELQGDYATFDFGPLPHGYGWIFPKSDHLSVGVFQARSEKAHGLRGTLEKFVASQGVLKEGKIIHLQGHQIPLGGRKEPLHKGRVLLLGDAANLADAWLGEGISYAIMSARLAAEAIFNAIQGARSDLSAYTARVHQIITPQLVQARYFASFVYRLPELGSILLSRSPWMQQVVFSAVRGNRTLLAMNRDLWWGLPRILTEAVLGRDLSFSNTT